MKGHSVLYPDAIIIQANTKDLPKHVPKYKKETNII